MTDIRDEVAAAINTLVFDLPIGEDVTYSRGYSAAIAAARRSLRDDLLRALAARGLTVVREGDCRCAERNVTHGRGCPCGNLARQPEGQ